MSVPSRKTIGRATVVAALGAPFASAGVARVVVSAPETPMVAAPARRHDYETEGHDEDIRVEPSMRAYSEAASSTADSITTGTVAPIPRGGGTNPAALAFAVAQLAPGLLRKS